MWEIFRKKKPEPKIQLRHRVRLKGWIVCECEICDCSKLSRWEDRLCIECWRGIHKTEQINIDDIRGIKD